MKKLLIVDVVAPYEYNFEIIKNKGLGASESYLLSVANELKKTFDVDITTSKVRYSYQQNDIVFKKMSPADWSRDYDTIIIQRSPKNVKFLRDLYPKANLIVWLHDFFEASEWATMSKKDVEYILSECTLVCVSKWHKENFELNFKLRKIKNADIQYNHFFINAPDIPENLKVDPFKLCFMSAGHKGMEQTLAVFKHIYKRDNRFKLYIANPTYDQEYNLENNDGVINLGSISRDEVMKHMKESLCCLHLNKEYPETFGCVNAESNLMGTPVLAYNLGATPEILDLPFVYDQILEPYQYRVDPNELTLIIKTLLSWQKDRPAVKLNPRLNKEKIMKKWIEIIS